MLFTEYNEEKIMEGHWRDGERNGMRIGMRIGLLTGNAFTNWLWLNGRGDEAQRVGQDQTLYDRLFDEYSRAQMVTQ